jgi:hypothetical protein
MKRVLKRLFTHRKYSHPSRPASQIARLVVEALEDRQLLSAAAPVAPAGPASAFQAANHLDLGAHLYSGTTLDRPLSATSAYVYVKDISGLPPDGSYYIRIDHEEMLVKGGFINLEDGWHAQVYRAQNDTTAMAHAAGAQVEVLDKSTILPYPSPRSPSGSTPDLRPTFVFSKIDGADHYDIWVNDLTTGTKQVLRDAQVPTLAVSLSFVQWQSDRNLDAGHKYEWRVRAISRYNGAGQWSPFTAFTDGVAAAPGAPDAPTWTAVSGNTIRLSWNNVGGNTGYVVQFQASSGWTNLGTTAANATTFVVNYGYGWSYRVRAANGTAFSPATYVGLGTPNAPTWAPGTGNAITLSWNKVDGATDYVVQYWNGSAWITLGKSGNRLSYGLSSGYGWYYRIGATNGLVTNYGNYTYVPVPAAPSAPQNFKWVQRYGNKIELQWDDVAAATGGFVVEYWNGANWVQLGSVLGPHQTVISIDNGYGWWWRVGAENSSGQVSYTDPLKAA